MLRIFLCTLLVGALAPVARGAEPTLPISIQVPAGFVVELAAAPPLVEHPLMAGFDDRGRLYVAENAGVNMQRPELEAKLPNYVLRLEDTNGDGRFDKRTIFADKLTFPQGALWHDGWLYVASSGAIWRFQDRDDDGVAEVREKIVGSFGYTGNAADVHGCFLGPEGRIWWCEGRHGHEIVSADGKPVSKGKAARIFSCRKDGSDVRVHCGGGMDNPVEIDWTPAGEMLGTVNIFYHQRGDCLVHWMHGGVYPRHDQPQMIAEFRRTGEPLDAVHDYGHVAVSGCCRVRGSGIPAAEAAAATFLVTQFNTHKVVQTSLVREGSSFRAETTEFLQAASDDFHPTDVLEDADGSLLVIDTGGWFRIGCPTSQIAKPNILGAIYRVRREAGGAVADPRGTAIDWNTLDATGLVQLLSDSRPAVRDRAMGVLVKQGEAAIPYLRRVLATGRGELASQSAIWCLARIDTPQSQAVVREVVLAQTNHAVLAAAIYCTGQARDGDATATLGELLATADLPPPLARQVATALGQIGDPAAVPAILARLAGNVDRVLEHALVYALIEIADRDATAKALADESPQVRRAGLIALDQMPGGNLARDEVAPLLDTTDQPLLTAALDVISRRDGWADELVALAGKLLAQPALTEAEQSLLSGALVGLAKHESVQGLVAQKLADSALPRSTRLLLIDVVGRSDLQPLPESWTRQLTALLHGGPNEAPLMLAAIDVAAAALSAETDALLLALCRDPARPLEVRAQALASVAPRLPAWTDGEFALVRTGLGPGAGPATRLAAARAVAAASLKPAEQVRHADLLAAAGPLEIRSVLAAFEGATEVRVGRALLGAIARSPGKTALTQSDLARLVAQFPDDAELKALEQALRSELPASELALDLGAIVSQLPPGGAASGKQVFFGRKAACSTCHRVGSEGGRIGPDLSQVGQRRNLRDLLEAVLAPSASLARGYESQVIRATDGRLFTGLVVRETPESLFLRTGDQREIRLRRADIEEQKPSSLSIMPAGLENTMTRGELADLLAYLRSLK